ncbi:hypothetical protein TcG_05267 [Trypanosoma cruzi]|nr:hypothetical protein TcG_05267 [Trypanosoma cruzi]
MTPFEQDVTRAFQLLGSVRVQSAMLHRSTTFCVDRCLDTEELYTLLRTTQAPIRYRLNADLAEKKCVTSCSAKWDELYRMTNMRVNEDETRRVQLNAMSSMMEAMRQ